MTRAIENEESLDALITHIQGFEGHILRVYDDGIGIPTIGYGYALVVNTGNADNPNWQIRADLEADFREAGIFSENQTLSQQDREILQQAASALNGDVDEAGEPIVSPITIFNHSETQTDQVTIHDGQGWSFSALQTQAQLEEAENLRAETEENYEAQVIEFGQAENLLRQIIDNYEQSAVNELAREAGTSVAVARERFNNLPHTTQLALIDLAFGGIGPIGPSLSSAINTEDPNLIAAWYEIRFRTNGGDQNVFNGINNRRQAEASLLDMSGVSEQDIRDYLSNSVRKATIENYLERLDRANGSTVGVPTFDEIIQQAIDQMVAMAGLALMVL